MRVRVFVLPTLALTLQTNLDVNMLNGVTGDCKDWCAKYNTDPWSTKCGWGSCNGCDGCNDNPTPAPTPAPVNCEGWCGLYNTDPWGTKCDWDQCKGCGECPPTPAPTPLPTPAPTTPGFCHDTPNNYMVQNGYDCATFDYVQNCKEGGCGSTQWAKDKTCQYSCFHAGCGYDGDDCTPAPTPAPTPWSPCTETDWDDASFDKCDFWGDPHWTSSFFGRKFNFYGYGVFNLSNVLDDSVIMQSYQCSMGGRDAAVAIAFAIKMGNTTIFISNKEVSVDGPIPEGLYTLTGSLNGPEGVSLTSPDGCSRINVNVKNGPSPGWMHNVKVRVRKGISKAEGLCGLQEPQLYVATKDLLFTAAQMNQLCEACNLRTPLICDGIDNPAPAPPTKETPADSCSEDPPIEMSVAKEKCSHLAGSAYFDACIIDYCESGGDDSMVENAEEEVTRTPPPFEPPPTPAPTPLPTPAPTPVPTPLPSAAPPGECVGAGDPHITAFDGSHFTTLAKERGELAGEVYMDQSDSGEFWVVKSHKVEIQGRYLPTEVGSVFPNVKALAVGGPFLRGNILTVRPVEVGHTQWNTENILLEEGSHFEFSDLVRGSDDPTLEPVLQRNIPKQQHLLFQLPMGVLIQIDRNPRSIAFKITMPPLEGGQDGQCGNFNGDAKDDTKSEILQRFDWHVKRNESLFKLVKESL